MKIKKFNETVATSKASKLEGDFKLYRLTSHPIVDLSKPGEFYFSLKSEIDTEVLKKKSKDIYLITVNCNSSNVDLDSSEKECAKYGKRSITVVKDDKKCDLVKVEPYLLSK